MKNYYAVRLMWPDGVIAVPLCNLSRETAEEYQRELQETYDKGGRGILVRVIYLPPAHQQSEGL